MSSQLYTERPFVRTAQSAKGAAWLHETPFLPLGWEDSNDVGAPSLKHSAMKKTLSDQRTLTPQLFENIPWPIASYLWDCLGRSGTRTLHMWKLFATAYPVEFREVSRYRSIKIVGPKASTREYLGLGKSDHLVWRMMLTLGNSFSRVPELVEISEIRNIVALEIITPLHLEPVFDEPETPVTALSDRIIRTWSELAQTSGAFSHLRVLILQRQTDLSRVALRYLKEFPSLQFVVVYECTGLASVFPQSCGEAEGWKVVETRELPPETLYEYYQAKSSDLSVDEPSGWEKAPILDFQIGQRPSLTSRKKTNSSETPRSIYLQRTEAPEKVDPEPNTKKRKGTQNLEGLSHSPSRTRKAVMKTRRAKDLGDVLKDFF